MLTRKGVRKIRLPLFFVRDAFDLSLMDLTVILDVKVCKLSFNIFVLSRCSIFADISSGSLSESVVNANRLSCTVFSFRRASVYVSKFNALKHFIFQFRLSGESNHQKI